MHLLLDFVLHNLLDTHDMLDLEILGNLWWLHAATD